MGDGRDGGTGVVQVRSLRPGACTGTDDRKATPCGLAGQASDRARVKVLSVLVPARRLLNHAGSTVPAIAQDGPSSERGSDMHPDELLQSSGAALRSSVPVRSKSENRVGPRLIS